MKRILSMLLALSICICACISLTACGSSAKFEYQLSDDGSYYIITAINITEKTEVLDIPAEYEGKPVKAIMSWVSVKNNKSSNLKEINIPGSIRFIKHMSLAEGCKVNFADYSNNLVPTSTFNFPKKGNDGSLNYNNLAPHTFYEFSVIIDGLVSSKVSADIEFPHNVVFVNSGNVRPHAESVTFAGLVSTYQEGNGENGWDEVTTSFIDMRICVTVEIPDVAVGKGYNKINVSLPYDQNNARTENLIVSNSVRQVRFSAAKSNNLGQLNIFFSGDDGFESTFYPEDDFPRHLIKDYYYSETQPTDSSESYWRYVNGVPTPW